MALSEITTRAEILVALGRSTSLSATEDALLNMIKPMAETVVRRYCQTGITQQSYTHLLPWADPIAVRDGWGFGSPHRDTYVNNLAFGGSRGLQLPEFPVRSITSLYEDQSAFAGTASGAFGSASELVEGTDFFPDYDQSGLCHSGILWRVNTMWRSRPGSIQVTYTAGYTQAELRGDVDDWQLDASDIRLATIKTIVDTFNETINQQSGQGGSAGVLKSERLGDYSYTMDTSGSGVTVEIPADAKLMLNRFRKTATMVM